ncbi:type ISP restriction/modification enzyme, partial [Nostoc sp.]
LFLNHQDNNLNSLTFYSELWGSRDSKYKWLSVNDVNITKWKNINLNSPNYFLMPQDTSLLHEYEKGWKITDIMPVNSVGFYSARDDFAIHWKVDEVINILKEFISLTVEKAREKYNLGKDARDWKVCLAQNDIKSSNLDESKIRKVSYRPFDRRLTYYTGVTRGLICMPRFEVMRHMINPGNLAICFIRRSREQNVSNFFVAEYLVDKTILSSADNANVAPLFIFPDYGNPQQSVIEDKKHPNLSPAFLKDITSKLGYTPTPEAIFYYIYAIFHSPTYRTRYAEFLKIDFPRVPLTSNNELFHQLANYGEELVALHLMKSPQIDNFITKFVENDGNNLVDAAHPKYNQSAVTINKKGDKFTGIPEEVWNFYVGGYQVCQKWLKDRKGRTLSDEDIQHYQRIIVALQQTIKLMDKIDQAIPGFPIQ